MFHLNISPGKEVELQAQKCSLPRYERSLRRIYQELQSLHVKYVGVRVKYCLCWPAPINGMWEGLWEKGRAGEGFPGGGRDWHMSPGVHVSAKVGVCCGLCPGRAGHGECSWECCTHLQAPACAAQAPLCSVSLGISTAPCPRKGVQPLPQSQTSCPSPVGSTGSCSLVTLLSHHVSIPG